MLTKLRKKSDKKKEMKLSDKARRFAHEYQKDYNQKQAAIRAGYAPKSAGIMAAKLLKSSAIQAIIGKGQREVIEKCELTREKILLQLYYCATRNSKDFVDEKTGELLPANKLSERASNCLDGIEQDVTILTNSDGEEIGRKIKTKYRFVSKAAAVDMAMKHFGQYMPEQHEIVHKLDWDALLDSVRTAEHQRVEQSIREARVIPAAVVPVVPAPTPPVVYSVQELIDGGDES